MPSIRELPGPLGMILWSTSRLGQGDQLISPESWSQVETLTAARSCPKFGGYPEIRRYPEFWGSPEPWVVVETLTVTAQCVRLCDCDSPRHCPVFLPVLSVHILLALMDSLSLAQIPHCH